ncbi:MAG: hypothetical protein KGZ83_09440 [Sulfuricella sp.]|nr:hypothetical protein [Sulfuricella sp.]
MFKAIRIIILLFILLAVGIGAWRDKTRSVEWKRALPVHVFLINGDGSQPVAEYLSSLTVDDFKPVASFMSDEAKRYGRSANASIDLKLEGQIKLLPPEPPHNGSTWDAIIWSLKMRWWVYRNTDIVGPRPQVKLFLLYFDPAKNKMLPHSTGLQEGLIGRVNLFASHDMAKQNNVVIAHEFLHVLGATDHYDRATNLPLFPDGYADPELKPLLPQHFAEIMAGRTPKSPTEAVIPDSLDNVVIGSKTALEINWR